LEVSFSLGRDRHHAALVLLTTHIQSWLMPATDWPTASPRTLSLLLLSALHWETAVSADSGIAGASRRKPLSFAEGSDARTGKSVASLLSFSSQHHHRTRKDAPEAQKMPLKCSVSTKEHRPGVGS
jgi:hypothetical protein